MKFHRILVPVDGSATSTKALGVALQLAQQAGGRVRLIHAIDELALVSGWEDSAFVMQAARDHGDKALARGLEAAKAAGVQAESRLIEAPGQRLGQVVATEATAWEADLVVVGSHGRRGVRRALLGSGAEGVMRLAALPVLVVRGDDPD